MTDTIATLLHREIVTLETVAQDGMRVRAHAGTSSFRRRPTLEECRQKAAEQVRMLQEEKESEDGPGLGSARQIAARERAARERLERVEQALKDLEELRKQKESRKKGTGEQARCSTTDAEARKMKMADGGFRPAYNVQFATDAGSRMIISVEVTNNGSDGGQMAPRHENIKKRYGKYPFFLLGRNVLRFPHLAAEIAAAGHEIGNHTHNHMVLPLLPRRTMLHELERTSRLIQSATGHRPNLVRSPLGWFSAGVLRILAEQGYRPVLGDVHPRDSARPGASVIAARVLARVQPGSIVILHDGVPYGRADRNQSVDAVAMVIDTLHLEYGFGTVTHLLEWAQAEPG